MGSCTLTTSCPSARLLLCTNHKDESTGLASADLTLSAHEVKNDFLSCDLTCIGVLYGYVTKNAPNIF